MNRTRIFGLMRPLAKPVIAALCLSSLALAGLAQSALPNAARQREAGAQGAADARQTVLALMLSDIHFEPFSDPAKVPQLAAAPASRWNAILAAAPSPGQEQRFAALEKACHARAADTDYTLLASSLRAMRAQAGQVKFVTVSGDLISHGFSCKYDTLFPASGAGSYREFVGKTLEFVMGQLRGAFPGTPVYAALGNNDSDCGDYRLDAHSEFLRTAGDAVVKGLPAAERPAALRTFAGGGYYSVALPAPIHRARLLVLDDLFMARRYSACSGKPDATEAAAQVAWLREQLASARRNKESVWVMSHIPPGIDPYSTAAKMRNICAGQAPDMFLSSEALPQTLAEFGDVVRLAIFAHTHMDEVRLLEPATGGSAAAARKSVAVKIVPSISPIDGNNPSFTVARVDPVLAMVEDYRVIAASNQTGLDATWTEEYDYAEAYRQTAFSAASLQDTIAGFKADPAARTEASRSYIRNYFVGDRSAEIKAFWPEYVCALDNDSAESYRACVCPAAR